MNLSLASTYQSVLQTGDVHMNRIKLFSLSLVLSLVGMVYAAGGHAQTTSGQSVQDKPSAGCCLSGADCKDGASCCAKHNSEHRNHSVKASAAEGDKRESCCASGCAKQQADGQKAAEQSCALGQRAGADCCGGAGCCKDDACQVAEQL